MRRSRPLAAIAAAVLLMVAGPATALAQERARHGGTLIYSVGTEPASFDGHREDSFATIHPFAHQRITSSHFINQDLRDVWLAE